jgi:two-component system, OmpR family, sensor histidine kinase BaeS
MAAQLDQRRHAEQVFMAAVSHDLRTPLTSIRGYSEAMRDGTVEVPAGAAMIERESQRLERLVADLLDLSKLRTGGFSQRPEPVDLAELAHEVAHGIRLGARRDVAVTVVGSGSVMVDRDRCGQLLANLAENAMKHARSHVVISVADGQLVVDDDGPGIDTGDRQRVFEMGWRGDGRAAGSGIGLAIVRELAQAMGARVSAGDAAPPLSGARFTVQW